MTAVSWLVGSWVSWKPPRGGPEASRGGSTHDPTIQPTNQHGGRQHGGRQRGVPQAGQQSRGALGPGDVQRERIAEREPDPELEKGAALALAAHDGVDLTHPLRGCRKAKAHAARQRGALDGVIGQAEQERLALGGELLPRERAGDGKVRRHGVLTVAGRIHAPSNSIPRPTRWTCPGAA